MSDATSHRAGDPPSDRPDAREVVIVSAARTPIGRFQGAFRSLAAPQLGAHAVAEAMRKAKIDRNLVDQVVMGCGLLAGVGQNPARQVALTAQLPESVDAAVVNAVGGSGLQAVIHATQALRTGDARVIVAGGMESMTNAPYILPRGREGFRLGNVECVDTMIHDGLLDAYNRYHMGSTGEIVASRYKITRHQADEYALRSHERALRANREGYFQTEIIPVNIPGKAGQAELVSRDEGPREATLDTLSRLRSAFQENGIVTAGNSSQISDGAAALVLATRQTAKQFGLPVLGVLVASAVASVKPEWVMEAPIAGVRALLERANLGIADVDLFEHNEDFATASCAFQKVLGVDDDRLNVTGGAISLGHPLGASGARLVVTLLHNLIRLGRRTGVATICSGGGGSAQVLIRREN